MSVYANGREVSGKAQPNKVISGFPSVCLSPPSPPAGPIPIPYPMFTDASKTSDGTGSVLIKKKEVGKKNGSTYASSKGNEPATRSFGMDVVSHTISGASKHQAYSFDVLFEKAGAERFMDLTTTNHGSDPATASQIDAAGAGASGAPPEVDCGPLESASREMRRATDDEVNRRYRNAERFDERSVSAQSGWVPAPIFQLSTGAHTAFQAIPGGAIRRTTAYGVSRQAMRQRGIAVQDQADLSDANSQVCGGGQPYAANNLKGHTEAQMLESVTWPQPNSPVPQAVAFSTNWTGRMADGTPDPSRNNRPCPDCDRKIAEACECGLKVYICKNGEAEDYCEQLSSAQ